MDQTGTFHYTFSCTVPNTLASKYLSSFLSVLMLSLIFFKKQPFLHSSGFIGHSLSIRLPNRVRALISCVLMVTHKASHPCLHVHCTYSTYRLQLHKSLYCFLKGKKLSTFDPTLKGFIHLVLGFWSSHC